MNHFKSRSIAPRLLAVLLLAVVATGCSHKPFKFCGDDAPRHGHLMFPATVTFSADTLFDFDRATLRPAGRQALDAFAENLDGVDFDRITVTGHTDRIGSHAYNQALSERRAESVKAYLVKTAELDADRIETRGVDGSHPVTDADDCPGVKRSAELIACLQPDRRVEIEVSGTR